MIATQIAHYTPTEYLELEDRSTIKHELIDGEIIPVAGASANHNRLNLNLCRLFPLEINGQDYEIFMNDMRLWLPVNQSYVYPDAIVIAEVPQFTDSKQTAVTNPCLIMEVLSTSTEGYDKSGKFRLYRSLPSFEEYLLIDQFGYRVEQYTKVDSHQWLLTEWLGEDAVMQLRSALVQIPLKDLYHRVSFNVSVSDVGE
jgi:Uma2 family endonuclease